MCVLPSVSLFRSFPVILSCSCPAHCHLLSLLPGVGDELVCPYIRCPPLCPIVLHCASYSLFVYLKDSPLVSTVAEMVLPEIQQVIKTNHKSKTASTKHFKTKQQRRQKALNHISFYLSQQICLTDFWILHDYRYLLLSEATYSNN